MLKFKTIKLLMKTTSLTLLCLVTVFSFTSVSYAEWSHGIGTGIFRLNTDGDMGIHTTLAGPVIVKSELDPDDINDLMETAFGLGGYSTDGTWMIKYFLSTLELEGTTNQSIPANAVLPATHNVNATINFEATGAEVIVGYPVYKIPSVTISVDGGLRYTKHEINSNLVISGPTLNRTLTRNIQENWTDLLIGTTIAVPFRENWIWNTSVNAGFGGSEGTYMGQTGVTWKFYEGWSSTLYGKYTAVEFENGNQGDADWYLYDVDEFGLGVKFCL